MADLHATGSRAAGRCSHPDCPDGIYDTDIPCAVCGIGKPDATPDRAAKSLLKPRELADYLGFHVDTIYQMAQSGEIRVAFRKGPRLRFDLDAVLAAQRDKEATR